jgi:hypothetical protein
MSKRKADVRIVAVPYATRFILLEESKKMPQWLIERIFPMETDSAIRESQWSSSQMHLCAMNYYVLFAAKGHYDLMEYVGSWLQKAFKLFQWYGDDLQDVQASFIRKQNRVVSHLLKNVTTPFEFTLHYPGGRSGTQELSDAFWPNVSARAEELDDLNGVIDSKVLQGAIVFT